MKNYARTIAEFCDAVITGNDKTVSIVKLTRPEFSAEARIAVYAGGYQIRLAAAVKADYPATAHFMGPDAFDQAVTDYVRATPSHHWDLNLYSIGFAASITDDAARAIALVESAIVEVFWLPDSVALTAQALAGLDMEALATKTFRLRSASRLLALNYAANEYITNFRAGNASNITKKAESIFLVRHDNEVQRHALEDAEYALLSSLSEGHSFGEALEKFSGTGEALQTYLARWLGNGFFQLDA